MERYVLDTNHITAILKKDQRLIQKIRDATIKGAEIFINAISYYEIKRGFLAINATTKLSKFNQFCQNFGVLLFGNISIFDEASTIHADLKKKGRPIGDADILIAALAKVHDLIILSANTRHFNQVMGLRVENWVGRKAA